MDSSIGPAIELIRQYKRRFWHGEGGKEQVDRISHLPDHITAYILSFLPTKEAIRTSLLSKRWRCVWNGITSIHLSGIVSDRDKFANLVNHVLRHCNPTICRRFYLSFSKSTDLSCVNTWIRHALSLKVEYLTLLAHDMDYYLPPVPPLPSCVLACSTLVVLELKSYFDVEVPDEVVCFPRLKSLKIYVVFPNHVDAVGKLLSRCPVLESFSLSSYLSSPATLTIEISTLSLRRLTLWFKTENEDGEGDNINKNNNYNIIINTPNLEYLSIEDDSSVCYEMKNVVGLCDVCVEYRLSGNEPPEKLLEVFKGISTTKRLTLHSNTVCELGIALCYTWDWPTFQYLDVLVIHLTILMHNWTWLPALLRSTSRLEVLVLDLELFDHFYHGLKWMPPDSIPMCLLEHLKIIGIKAFCGDEDELPVVEYLLKSSKVLDSMMIDLVPSSSNRDLVQKLLMLPRASTTCDVQIFENLRIDADFTSPDYKIAFSGTRIYCPLSAGGLLKQNVGQSTSF